MDAASILIAWQPGRYELVRGSGGKTNVTIPSLPAPLEIKGPWDVAFPPQIPARPARSAWIG